MSTARTICAPCKGYDHMACVEPCQCPVLMHRAFPRPGDDLKRVAERVKGCAQLMNRDPAEARRQLDDIARILDLVADNFVTAHWLLRDVTTADRDISARY